MRFPDNLDIPAETLDIVRKLEDAGYETWCVGGALRDALLNLAHSDFDIATAASPERVSSLFRRTVPVGIEHGTVAVLDRSGQPHEVTTFRRDVRTDGRHAEVEFGVSLAEDLGRRDFTINAIAYHPIREDWRDPFGGRDDLDRGVVRAVGQARQRFAEDFLRILRAIRFATRFGFKIEAETWEAARDQAGGLKQLSAERVRDEWFKSLATAMRPSDVVSLWHDIGAIGMWFAEPPSLDPERVSLLDSFPERDPVLMTSWLMPGGARTLERLRCSRAEIQRAAAVERFGATSPEGGSAVEVRRWLSGVGGAADDLLTIFELESKNGKLREVVDCIRRNGDPLRIAELAVSGEDLKRAGVPEGPAIGRALATLLAEVLEEPGNNSKECLLDIVKRLTDGETP